MSILSMLQMVLYLLQNLVKRNIASTSCILFVERMSLFASLNRAWIFVYFISLNFFMLKDFSFLCYNSCLNHVKSLYMVEDLSKNVLGFSLCRRKECVESCPDMDLWYYFMKRISCMEVQCFYTFSLRSYASLLWHLGYWINMMHMLVSL